LLTLHGIGAGATLQRCLEPALRWMAAQASSREEHFMTIAVVDECAAAVPVPRSVAFFRGLETPDGTFGPSPLQNGIAASALLRAGEPLRDPEAVARLLLAAQAPDGGFADVWTTYCVMRALDLLGATPDGPRLARWVLDRLGTGTGSAAGVTYQCLSILDWIATPVLEAARRGDCVAVRRHLQTGGDPDIHDLTGWTPLAAAAVHGQAPVVRMLLAGDRPADPDLRVPDADALPVFWAAQSGDLDTVRTLLQYRPEQLHAISSVNGHTVLLQAVFFGTQRHCELVAWLLDHVGDAPAERTRLLAACNVRGYTARTMAELWHNEPMAKLLSVVDDTTEQERDAYRADLLASIAGPPDPAVDALIGTISRGLDALNAASAGSAASDAAVAAAEQALLSAVTAAVEAPGFDVNRCGGPLGQTPVIAAVTGVDADARVAAARVRLTDLLLRHGADPDLPERHPMAVDAVIRAAVLNHFACLQTIARYMGPLAFAAALNERPAINGQTALDDTVHRALTAPDDALQSHLDQIRWAIEHGASSAVPDLTGVTVADRARLALRDDVLGRNAPRVLAALGLSPEPAGGG
jgi:hypothetical protein